MKFTLTDEQKKLFKRVGLLAKSYKPEKPEIFTIYTVEQGGGLEEHWNGPECEIQTSSGMKDIKYESFYEEIFEFIDNNSDVFLEPFYDQDDSWGEITCEFNYEEKILRFTHDVRYYESSYSEQSGTLTGDKAQELINVKNSSEDLQGNIISMEFDGGGDSGYIENNGENELGESIEIPSFFEDFGYNVLEKYYGGWENNEGGHGTISLDFSNPGQVKWSLDMNMNGEEGYSDLYSFEVKLDY